MTARTLFPRLLAACFALFITASAIAQTSESGSRKAGITRDQNGSERLETEFSVPPAIEERRPRLVGTAPVRGAFDQLLLSAIQSHLGTPYRYTGTGPDSFDCSGLVWRTFQEAGMPFTRGPARSYWATFTSATKEEQFKFGTLVFFSGLTHVGIVADEKGFYHSSRRNGVIYSPFSDYWLSRIDGFRRVTLDSTQARVVTPKTRATKPANAEMVDEDNRR